MARPEGFSTPEGYRRGIRHEEEVLGGFVPKAGYREAFDRVKTGPDYVDRKTAFELVRQFSSDNPTAPKKAFAASMRMDVASALRLQSPEEFERLRYYTSVGDTVLDKKHGVDAWIEFEDGGKTIIVTLDATLRDKEEEGLKRLGGEGPDFEVPELPDAIQEKEAFETAVRGFGAAIANRIKSNLPANSAISVRLQSIPGGTRKPASRLLPRPKGKVEWDPKKNAS